MKLVINVAVDGTHAVLTIKADAFTCLCQIIRMSFLHS